MGTRLVAHPTRKQMQEDFEKYSNYGANCKKLPECLDVYDSEDGCIKATICTNPNFGCILFEPNHLSLYI